MFPNEVNAGYRTTQLSLGPPRVFSAGKGVGGGWGDCILSRRASGTRRSCFLMRSTPIIVLPDKGGPGGGSDGEEAGDRVLSL